MKQSYWESRYEAADTGWNIGRISTPVKEYLDQLKNKDLRILIPGCGYGYEAIYAHRLGFKNVTVLDFVAEPLDVLRENEPGFPENHILQEDFFSHADQYDRIIEQTLFCAIDPADREKYAQQIQKLLVPGGKLVGLLFNRDFESGPPFGGSKEEYKLLFSKYFQQVSIEDCYNSIEPRKGSEVFIRIG